MQSYVDEVHWEIPMIPDLRDAFPCRSCYCSADLDGVPKKGLPLFHLITLCSLIRQRVLNAQYVDCRARPRNDGPFTNRLLSSLATASAIPVRAFLVVAQLREFGANWLIPEAASTLEGSPHFSTDQFPCGDPVRSLMYGFFVENQTHGNPSG